MSVWATYSNWQSGDEMTIEEDRNWTLQHLASDELPAAKVIHKTRGKDWFVLSGVSKKNIFYQRTLKIHDAFVTVLFIYPQTKKIEFEPVVLRAARSLKE